MEDCLEMLETLRVSETAPDGEDTEEKEQDDIALTCDGAATKNTQDVTNSEEEKVEAGKKSCRASCLGCNQHE